MKMLLLAISLMVFTLPTYTYDIIDREDSLKQTIEFRERWMSSLDSHIEKNLLYYHQVRLANKLL